MAERKKQFMLRKTTRGLYAILPTQKHLKTIFVNERAQTQSFTQQHRQTEKHTVDTSFHINTQREPVVHVTLGQKHKNGKAVGYCHLQKHALRHRGTNSETFSPTKLSSKQF